MILKRITTIVLVTVVAMIVWLFAEAESVRTRKVPLTVQLVADPASGFLIRATESEAWQERAVVTVSGSASALAAFEANPGAFDAVLCDMTMPQLTGDSLARAVLARRPDLPVFLCTGYNDRMDAAMARMVGVRAIFEKPIDFDRVLGELSEALAATAPP